jgi:hypothetical protein
VSGREIQGNSSADHPGENIRGALQAARLQQITDLMEVDFQSIRTDELKSRIGELRRYL